MLIDPEFTIWMTGWNIVRFSSHPHEEFATYAGPSEIMRFGMPSPETTGVIVNWESGRSHMTISGLHRTWQQLDRNCWWTVMPQPLGRGPQPWHDRELDRPRALALRL
jgi:hypothetical protein